MRSGIASILSLLALVLAGCASSQFDRHFEARRYADVARIFEADSALHNQERALFRAGLAHAHPESPVYEPERARERLERLLLLFPQTAYRQQATHALGLVAEVERLTRHAEERDREIERLAAEVAEQRLRTDSLETALTRHQIRTDLLQQSETRLRAQLRERESQIQALQAELAGLKEIDLNRAPAPGTAPPRREPPRPGNR